MKKGDRFVARPLDRPCDRLFIEVMRVAKDHSWADITACTWASMWRVRISLEDGKFPVSEEFPAMDQFEWDISDLNRQEADHMKMLRERGIIGQ